MRVETAMIAGQLQALPGIQPNSAWKKRTKRRLLQAYGRLHGKPRPPRRWAIFVSRDSDPKPFARAFVSRGRGWRPVTVDPDRLPAALAAIHPALVAVDAHLPNHPALLRTIHACSRATVVSNWQVLLRAY